MIRKLGVGILPEFWTLDQNKLGRVRRRNGQDSGEWDQVIPFLYRPKTPVNPFLLRSPPPVQLNAIATTSTGEIEYNVNMAAALLTALPPLLVYFVSGRFFVRGITAGAVKG